MSDSKLEYHCMEFSKKLEDPSKIGYEFLEEEVETLNNICRDKFGGLKFQEYPSGENASVTDWFVQHTMVRNRYDNSGNISTRIIYLKNVADCLLREFKEFYKSDPKESLIEDESAVWTPLGS